jgi:RNA polymerase sigma factor (sigma-70 family)
LIFRASAAITQGVNTATLSNRELVIRLATADQEDPAWLEFVSRFQWRIRRTIHDALLRASGRQPSLEIGDLLEVVDDLTQDVFLRLITGERRALAHFRGRNENSIYTYLDAIATNLVRDHLKMLRARARPAVVTSLDEPKNPMSSEEPAEPITLGDKLTSPDPDPSVTAQESELSRHIVEAVEETSKKNTAGRDRLIFRLYFLEGLTVPEIASIRVIKLSASGIEKRIAKFRSAAKKVLQKEGG